ncbi:MAG TPA: hypothetical protein VK539_03165 [Myxococcaceae bacterium]|nr:hypothetical protein [Myxococcaceae bacterium]
MEQDLAPALDELKGFLQRHQAELRQWYEEDGVTPTLGAMMALLRFFQGLSPAASVKNTERGRRNGLGVQLPLRWWATNLKRNKNTVCEAKALGEELGFLECYSPIRPVSKVTEHRPLEARLEQVTTRDGAARSRVHVHGVVYLTPKGAAWLDRRGTTEAELQERNPRQRGRGRVLTGIMWDVLRTLRTVRSLVAARFSQAPTEATPDDRAKPPDRNTVVVSPVGNPPLSWGAVRPAAADIPRESKGPQEGARAADRASAPPAPGNALQKPPGGLGGPPRHDAGLSGGGALSPLPGKPRGVGYGPPLTPGWYLDAETERCWLRHVVIEGGPPREVRVKSRGIGGQWLGDYRTVLETGRVLMWSPALVAEQAYPNEWRAARGLEVVQLQLEADFRMYLGPRLRRRFMAREDLRAAGVPIGCPVEGCRCQER